MKPLHAHTVACGAALLGALAWLVACSDQYPTVPGLNAAKGGGSGPPQPPADPVIAFVNLKRGGGTDQLLVINADGSSKTVVYAAPHILRPSWSPNGGSIVFRRDGTTAELWIVDVVINASTGKPEGNNARLLTATCGQSILSPYIGCEPAWSPGGGEIAFTEGKHLSLIPASGGTPQLLYNPAGDLESPTWSPDGNRIAVVEGGLTITILDLTWDGSGTVSASPATKLSFPGFPSGFQYVDNVDWSRTHPNVLSFSGLPVGGGRTVYTLDLLTPTPQAIVAGYDPTWSPNDEKLAFIQGSREALVSRVLATGASTTLAVDALEPDWARRAPR